MDYGPEFRVVPAQVASICSDPRSKITDLPAPTTPIVCDMTGAPDTGPERLREYQRLFSQALIGREKTAAGICFRLRAQPGTEAWVRDLAAREKACCAFFTFTITHTR